jgi:outer membrane receptor protein involved in Fe transport
MAPSAASTSGNDLDDSDDDVVQLSGLTDVKIRMSGPLVGDRLLLIGGVNLPTGTTRLSADQLNVLQVVGAPGQSIILNGLRAKTYGAELSLTFQATDWLKLRGGYTFFQKRILLRGNDLNRGRGEGNDPHHQFLIQSMINLPANIEFDSVLRYVDKLNQLGPLVPGYFSLDLHLGWRPTPNWEFAIVGQNLLDRRHVEFGAPATSPEIPRSVYGRITWKFWTPGNGAAN